jgi:predicted acetyltransferase
LTTALTYRFATAAEIPGLARLVAHSFPGGNRTLDWIETQLREPVHGGGPDTLFVGEERGRAVAALQIHPFRQFIGGVPLPMAGIGTVTVAPTHRRRRLAAELMTNALRVARDRGDVVSALYPFRTEFYARLGYGQADLAHQYQIAPDMLRDAPERLRVELLDDDVARSEALRLYQHWAPTQTGQLQRGERLWQQLCTEDARVVVGYRGDDGALEGYALVTYLVDSSVAKRTLEVDEIVWLTPAARRGLYAWLASMSDQWREVVLRALPAQRLGDWIREPRLPFGRSAPTWRLWAPGATLMYGTMSRIVDMHGAWTQRRVDAGASLAFGIEVDDEQIDDNRGRWRLELDGGRVAIRRDAGTDVTLRLNISTLSRLYIGALSPLAALEAGLLECDRPDALQPIGAALALPEPWTFDRF